jgi:hypothetical protein
VNYLLTKIDYNANENFILPKFSTYVLLRFKHKGATGGSKETSYTKDEMSYEEAEPSQQLLTSEPCFKRHTHQRVKFYRDWCI